MTVEQLESRECPADGWNHNFHRQLAPPVLPPETVGTGYVVYLENATPDTVDATAYYYAGLWDVVELTNVRPDLPTDRFLTVHFGVSHDYFVGRGFPNAVGLSGVGIVTLPGGPDENWVQYPADGGQLSARVAAHEAGHAFGLEHNTVYGSVMYTVLAGPFADATFVGTEPATIRAAALEAVR